MRQSYHVILSLLCYVTRRFQYFPKRYALVAWLERKKHDLARLAATTRSVHKGCRLFIDPRDFDGIRYLIHGLNPREPISNAIIQCIEPGDTILDVGANVGYFTMLSAICVGPSGSVAAFEASPETYRQLQIGLRHGPSNITSYSVAVSDTDGSVSFSLPRAGHTGTASLRSLGDRQAEKITVECIKLDSLLSELRQVKLIKIDVEGAEMKVLRGAENLINRDRPILIVEVTKSFLEELGDSINDIFSFMVKRGYVAYRIGHGRFERLSDTDISDFQTDIMFTPSPATTISYRNKLIL